MGQSLNGSIHDHEDDTPLSGATVFVPGIQIGVATDANGQYELVFPRPGTYRVVFRYVGYQTETREVAFESDEQLTLSMTLSHAAIEAAPMTVTAKAQTSDILSTPQPVAVVESSDIARLKGAAALDALNETGGVRLLRTGPGIAKPMIRGLTSQRVLVIQDGVRQEGQQWGDEHGPELDGTDIDRIEIVKGPASLLYGSDALGGVVHATSTDLFADPRQIRGGASLQGTSNNAMGGGSVNLSGHTNGYVYKGSLGYRKAGGFDTPDSGVIHNTGLTETVGSVRLGRSFKNGRLLVGYQHLDSDIGLFEPEEHHDEHEDGHENQHEDEHERGQPGRYDLSLPFQTVVHGKASGEFQYQVAGNRIDVEAAWQENRRKEFEDEHDEESELSKSTTDGGLEPALDLRLQTFTTDIRVHHRPVGQMFGTIGVSGFFQKNETLGEETLIPAGDISNLGVYVTEEWLLSKTTVSAGVRYDHRLLEVEANEELGIDDDSRSWDALSGALGVAWQPSTGVSIGLNIGRAWRAPVLIELYGSGVHHGTIRFERGDAGLKTEQSMSFDGTLRWMSRHHYFEVSSFVNVIDDYIFPLRTGVVDEVSGFEIYQYDQAEARIVGGEFRLDVHPHAVHWLHLGVSGDLTRGMNRDTDEDLAFMPPDRIRFQLGFEQEDVSGLDEVHLNIGQTFVLDQNRIDPTELTTDGHSLLDISVTGELQVDGFRLTPTLSIDNVLDVGYLNHLSRYRPVGIQAPGRNVRLSIRVET